MTTCLVLTAVFTEGQTRPPGSTPSPISRWLEATTANRAALSKLATSRALGCRGTTAIQTPRGQLLVLTEFRAVLPHHYEERTRVDKTETTTVLDKQIGWVDRSGERRALSDDQRQRLYGAMYRRYFVLLSMASRDELHANSADHQSFRLSLPGAELTLMPSESGRIERIELEGRSLRGEPVHEVRTYSDFRAIAGVALELPHQATIYQNGRPEASSEWQACWLGEPPE